MKITVFDTPGLADGTGNDKRYLRQILQKVTTVDLLLFCTDMASRRFSDDDARTIRKLTKTFGASLWEHALVVLTFANEVHLNAKEEDHTVVDPVQQQSILFQKRIRDFQQKIQDCLFRGGVHQEAVSKLPFVPAGETKKPRLPDRDNWLTALWIAAFKRINRNAKADFLLANFDRISIFQSPGGLSSENRAETDSARGGGAEEGDKEDGNDKDKFLTKGTLKESSSEEAKRGGFRRRLASVSRALKDRFLAQRGMKSLQGSMDEKDSEKKTSNAGHKRIDTKKDCADGDRCDDHGDDVKSRGNRLSVSEPEREGHVYSPHESLIQYSPAPANDEVVTSLVPLPMDETCFQDLVTETLREEIGSQESLAVQCGFSRIYAAFFARIMELIRKLLREKKTTEARRQGEDADKF